MSTQFVACNAVNCPMNEGKQCRAPFIMIDKDGICLTMKDGPHEDKAQMESYVDLRECGCSSCNNWEKDANTGLGKCGFGADLFMRRDKIDKGNADAPICHEFEKQIQPPGWTAVIDE